jgi:NADH-quinone oxidoreductase subunit L
MTIPLVVLAVLSAVGGFINVPEVLGGHHWLSQFLSPVLAYTNALSGEALALDHATEYVLMAVSVGAALIAIAIAYVMYISRKAVPAADTEERAALSKLSYHKFYIDELYDAMITRPLDAISQFFFKVVDKLGIDGLVNGLGTGAKEASKGLRLIQTGNVGFYIFMMVVGIIALLIYGFYHI